MPLQRLPLLLGKTYDRPLLRSFASPGCQGASGGCGKCYPRMQSYRSFSLINPIECLGHQILFAGAKERQTARFVLNLYQLSPLILIRDAPL